MIWYKVLIQVKIICEGYVYIKGAYIYLNKMEFMDTEFDFIHEIIMNVLFSVV